MVLVPDPRNMPVLLTLLRKKKPTVITLVPAFVRKLLEHCDAKDFTATRFVICGGAALPYELLKKFKERTGHMIVEGYGLSEASPVTHCNIPRGLSVKRSIGLPIANTEAKIVDETGQEVPVGEERRTVGARSASDAGVLEQPCGNGERAEARGVARNRRHRAHGSRRLLLHRGSEEGYDPVNLRV